MKSHTFRENTRRTVRVSRSMPQPQKRSQLMEKNERLKHLENFQNWLLHVGGCPEAGLPASQIGMYTDFN